MGEGIIEVSNLTKQYGVKTAVNQLNLSIKKGEIFGLLGPNGAGKTTTILMLLGLTEPTAGTAAIGGMDCTRNAIGVKRITGYLPDNLGFYPDLTGRQNLAFTGRLNGMTEEEIRVRSEQLLKRVGMEEAADKKTATYSKRSSGTLNRLVSQPIYRDSIIIGKFLAGSVIAAIMVFSMGIFIGAIGVIATGLVPEAEEVLRILAFLIFTTVYIDFWLGLSILFSVVCRHSATSAMAVIALWIFFTIFMSLVASMAANMIYPVDSDYNAILNSMNMEQLDGAISGYLSWGQSMLLVWPHLTGLIALMLAAFGGAYIGFMRQEIRS